MASINGEYSRASTSLGAKSELDTGRGRPASIQELAQRAEIIWDPAKDFKFWLKYAERARHAGQSSDLEGDLENAFVEYAKAATLILDKIPTHRDYHTRLDATQRETLISKGKGVLDRMGMLKPPLIDRHNAWDEAESKGTVPQQTPRRTPQKAAKNIQDYERRDATPPHRRASVNTPQKDGRQIWYPDPASIASEKRRRDAGQTQAVQVASARPEQRAKEQAGILQRQREAEEEAQIARRAALYDTPPTSSQPALVTMPVPNPATSQRPSAQLNGRTASGFEMPAPPLLPLESPNRYDGDSTDVDTEEGNDEELYRKIADLSMNSTRASSSVLAPFGGPPIPPITTTSAPPPTFSAVSYPQLMSQHQRTQGYTPSLQSMFMHPHTSIPQSTLLFDNPLPSDNLYQNLLPAPSQPAERDYSTHGRAYMYGPREPPAPSYSNRPSPRPSVPPRPSEGAPLTQEYRWESPAPPFIPQPPAPAAAPSPRIAPASSTERKDPRSSRELKTVNFPRSVLPRFLSIASVNTAKNRETCGLLLGKQKGEKYIVTTLLIPRQHSTSDTCTMDEEELVLEFTEKRSLITLGWIHTHPSQSCFMSSVDLHTHSGFQQMLPECFAVVCAPQYTPTFGIFRLTDPPGLQAILDCKDKNAFHPHPDVPIYTDADKGHVQMKDMQLEIVDIR